MPFDPNKPFEVVTPTASVPVPDTPISPRELGEPAPKEETYVVNDPTLGTLRYPASKWNEQQISADLNVKREAANRIAQGYPQFLATEAWLKAKTPEDGLAALYDWAASNPRQLVGEGAKLAIQAYGVTRGGGAKTMAQEAAQMAQRAGFGALSELVGGAIKGQMPTKGQIAQTAIETAPGVSSTAGKGPEEVAANILKLTGFGMAGEGAKQALEGKGYDIKKIEEAGLGGGLSALGMHLTDSGARAASAWKKVQQDAPLMKTLEQANNEGLLIDLSKLPTAGLGTSAGTIASGGQSLMQEAFSKVNQRTMKDKLTQFFNVPDLVEGLNARKDYYNGVYKQVANLSPAAAAAELDWQKAMNEWSDASRLSRFGEKATVRATARDDARIALADANSAFQKMVSEANAAGNPNLVNDLKQARVKLAQIHSVQTAVNPATGNIDGRIIGDAYKDNPKYFTDILETIGRLGAAMPEVVQDPQMIGNKYRDLLMRGTTGSLGATAGYGVSALTGISPTKTVTAGMAAGSAIPSFAQKIMASAPVQRAGLSPNYAISSPDLKAALARFAIQDASSQIPSGLNVQRFLQDVRQKIQPAQ